MKKPFLKLWRWVKWPLFSKGQWIAVAAIIVPGVLYIWDTFQNQEKPIGPSSIYTQGQSGGVNIINSDEEAKLQLKYFDISKYDLIGLPGDIRVASEQLSLSTGISKKIGPHIFLNRDPVEWECTPQALGNYLLITKTEPLFPFSYFYFGSCLKVKLNNPEWTTYMRQAKKILEITTSIPGHHVNHDEFLQMINKDYNVAP
jgi:hypothetical protein